MRIAVMLLVVLSLPRLAIAATHGPVFGLATPTNSQGEWSFDQGVFGRNTSLGAQASFRELLGYGLTPHLTLSFTLPAVIGSTPLPPTRIQPGADFDSTVAWRFQHRATKVGTRIETTAFADLVVPGPQSGFRGIAHTTNVPGTMLGIVSGMASRSHYVWLGSTYTKFYEHNGGQTPRCTQLQSGVRLSARQVATTTGQMGLEIVRRIGWRTLESLPPGKRSSREHASAPGIPRANRSGNLSQLHRQFRRSVSDLSERRFGVSKGTCPLRG